VRPRDDCTSPSKSVNRPRLQRNAARLPAEFAYPLPSLFGNCLCLNCRQRYAHRTDTSPGPRYQKMPSPHYLSLIERRPVVKSRPRPPRTSGLCVWSYLMQRGFSERPPTNVAHRAAFRRNCQWRWEARIAIPRSHSSPDSAACQHRIHGRPRCGRPEVAAV
jgi:hypothetical protein